jgi:hypothetical protein
MNAAQCIASALADVARLRFEYIESLDLVAMPGKIVYVLHDGRKGWMHGESGTVVWANREWAEVMFRDRGPLRFMLKRLSRKPDGIDCWRGLLTSGARAGYLATDR